MIRRLITREKSRESQWQVKCAAKEESYQILRVKDPAFSSAYVAPRACRLGWRCFDLAHLALLEPQKFDGVLACVLSGFE